MKQITIYTAEKENRSLYEKEKDLNAKTQSKKTFTFKQFTNCFLQRMLPEFEPDQQVLITNIPNWELPKIYRIIINQDHNIFSLIVDYKEEDVINKY